MSHLKQNLGGLIDNTITNFAAPTLAEISKVDHENYTCKCTGISKTGEKTDVVYPKVSIPKFWASSTGGIFMAPSPETIVLLNFLDNDTNYPIIAAIMGSNYSEESKEDTLIITCGDTKLILEDKKISISTIADNKESKLIIDDRIFLSADGVNIGQLLTDMIETITKLETIVQTPLTGSLDIGTAFYATPAGVPTAVTGGTVTVKNGKMPLDPAPKDKWLKEQSDKIAKIFHIDEPSKSS